jgi:hypothetical protein
MIDVGGYRSGLILGYWRGRGILEGGFALILI